MPEQGFGVPTLEGMDPMWPDYVQRLEKGFEDARQLADEQRTAGNRLLLRYHDELLAEVRKIEGVELHEFPQLSEEERSGDQVVNKYSVIGAVFGTNDRNAARRAEDAIRESRRRYDDNNRTIEDRKMTARRAVEDFAEALVKLSELTPLNDVDMRTSNIHLYVLRKDGVYEVHADLRTGSVHGPQKNEKLTVGMLTDKGFLEEFKAQAEGIGANAYKVTNPSEAVPLEVLVDYGLDEAAQTLSFRRDAEEQGKSPLQSALDGIRLWVGR